MSLPTIFLPYVSPYIWWRYIIITPYFAHSWFLLFVTFYITLYIGHSLCYSVCLSLCILITFHICHPLHYSVLLSVTSYVTPYITTCPPHDFLYLFTLHHFLQNAMFVTLYVCPPPPRVIPCFLTFVTPWSLSVPTCITPTLLCPFVTPYNRHIGSYIYVTLWDLTTNMGLCGTSDVGPGLRPSSCVRVGWWHELNVG